MFRSVYVQLYFLEDCVELECSIIIQFVAFSTILLLIGVGAEYRSLRFGDTVLGVLLILIIK